MTRFLGSLTALTLVVAACSDGNVASAAPAVPTSARRSPDTGAPQRRPTQGSPMSGALADVPLPDLLQLLLTSRKTGVLTVSNGVSVGKIFLRNGEIYFATVNADLAISAQESLFHMVTWMSGTFALEPNVAPHVKDEIKQSTPELLMDAVDRLAALRNLLEKLPRPSSALAVPTPLAGKLHDLNRSQLDTFQLVLDHGQLQKVLDNFPGSDLDAAQSLIALMKRDFVVVP